MYIKHLQNLHYHNSWANKCLTQPFQNSALPTVNNHWHIFVLFEPTLIHLSLHFCQWSGGIFLSLVTQDCSSTFSSTGFYSARKWVRFVEHDLMKIVPGLYIIYDYAAGKQCSLGCLCGYIHNYLVHSGKHCTCVLFRHSEGKSICWMPLARFLCTC